MTGTQFRKTRRTIRYLALLRGINVAGKNRLLASDLVTVFAGLGCDGVTTFLQSGNVLFRSSTATARRLSAEAEAEFDRRFGLSVPVVLRTAREFRSSLSRNPFARSAVDAKALHVAFLAQRPSAKAVRSLDPDRSPGDAFAVVGRELFLHLGNGVARSKLTNAYFDAVLGTISTVRNWRTVRELAVRLASPD